MARPRDDRQKDLLRPALEEIIDMSHLLERLVAWLFILKHMHNVSDEVLCARWLENPYYQHFCGSRASATGCPSTARLRRAGASAWGRSSSRR